MPNWNIRGRLIHELQRKLHLARRPRREDMVECRRTDVAVGQPEVRVIQEIEELRPELEFLSFGYWNVLEG